MRTGTRLPWGLTSGRFPSAAGLMGGPPDPPTKNSLALPPRSAFRGHTGGFPVDSRPPPSAALISAPGHVLDCLVLPLVFLPRFLLQLVGLRPQGPLGGSSFVPCARRPGFVRQLPLGPLGRHRAAPLRSVCPGSAAACLLLLIHPLPVASCPAHLGVGCLRRVPHLFYQFFLLSMPLMIQSGGVLSLPPGIQGRPSVPDTPPCPRPSGGPRGWRSP